MKIVFLSNYFNHHQKPFSECISKISGVDYVFIETEKMETERKNMGWGEKIFPDYVKKSYISTQSYVECCELIDNADVVIYGSAPYKMLKQRLKSGKLILRYSERFYKTGFNWYEQPLRTIKYYRSWGRFKNVYMLCASAYTYADCLKTFNFKNKAYKWGYFPELKEYEDVSALIKQKDDASILWVARLIDWKHPEIPVLVAERLKNDGYKFKLNIIGNGTMEKQIAELIKAKSLDDCVFMLGAMKPEDVRTYMEKSQIFLCTSDFNEGWGAVLNESMNSACAAVASHAIGSVPYLIEDGKNGFVYKNGDIGDLCNKVKFLLDNTEKRNEIGKNAYFTIKDVWNAKIAAERVVCLATKLLEERKSPNLFENGPCCKAEKLKNNWYK